MGRILGVVWLVVIVGALALLGQALGLYNVPLLPDVRGLLPGVEQPAPVAAAPTASVSARASPSIAIGSPTLPATDVCTSSSPRFVHGTATLKAAVGASLGEPLECERVVDAQGNTEQKTTTGLAYYRAQDNIAAFTNGFDHWAMTPAGAVHWTSDDLEPPADAEPVR